MDHTTISRWDNGITDGYLSAPGNRSYALDNLYLDDFGKPYTRPGLDVFTTRVPTGANNSRLSGIYIESEPWTRPLVVAADQAFNLSETNTWTEIVGPTGNRAFAGKGESVLESSLKWRKQIIGASASSNHLPCRIYCTSYAAPTAFKALTLGLPRISTPTVTSSGGAGSNYVYAFHFYYTFTDYDGTTFEEKGPVVFVTAANIGAPNVNNVSITNVQTLANTAYTNYDTSINLKIKIFRTINAGTTYYLLTTLNNGTTSYTDSTSDATIQTGVVLYTDGGVLEYTQPPTGTKYVTQVNDYFWWASDTVLTHSIQGAPGACPAEFQQPMDQKIYGLSSTISFPICFCEKSVYRLDGVFDEFGNGGFEPHEISPTAGCLSSRSIVRIPGGLVWAGNGGFYFTDGDKVEKISHGLDERYKAWANASIEGVYDPNLNMVHWTVAGTSNATNFSACDSMATLHLDFPITDSSTFTWQSGQGNWFPVSLAYTNATSSDSRFSKRVLIGERRGYLCFLNENRYSDLYIDTDKYPSQFRKQAIIYNWTSLGMDLGDDGVRKYVTDLTAELRDDTNISCQFYSRRDDGGPWAGLSEIRTDGAIIWGVTEVPWNSTTLDQYEHEWNSQKLAEGARGFPAGTLRSTRRQIKLTNSKTWIDRSDLKGTASSNAITKRVTLDDGTKLWPEDCEDYEIIFGTGITAASTGYIIKTRVSDTVIEVFDPYGTLTTTATRKWQIRGYRKDERLYLLSATIHFDVEGATQAANRGTAGMVNV